MIWTNGMEWNGNCGIYGHIYCLWLCSMLFYVAQHIELLIALRSEEPTTLHVTPFSNSTRASSSASASNHQISSQTHHRIIIIIIIWVELTINNKNNNLQQHMRVIRLVLLWTCCFVLYSRFLQFVLALTFASSSSLLLSLSFNRLSLT